MAQLKDIRPSINEIPLEAQKLLIAARRLARRTPKEPQTKAKKKRKSESKKLFATLKDPQKARELLKYLREEMSK